MSTSTRVSRLAHRLDVLDALDEGRSQGYDKSLAALKHLWEGGRKPTSIRLRALFIEVSSAVGKAPASLLINSRGHALRVALLALFVAQTKRGSAPHLLDLPLSAKRSADVAWEDLIVTAANAGPGSASRKVHQKRAGSARAALNRLARPDVSLLDLPRLGQRKGVYDEVRLFEDSGPRAMGLPVAYSIPTAGMDVVTVPVDFFLNGWLYVLEDTEIATYLMYRRLCSQSTPAHISAEVREQRFGIKQSAWEQYWVLASTGLLLVESDENRRPDGTFADQSSGATPRRHRFTLRDDGLTVDALGVVWSAVDRRMAAG
jgi:hypothetical protein